MTIIKKGSKFILKSKKTGKKLGQFRSKKAALKREKQIQFFKNVKKSTGSLRSKVRKKSLLK